MSGRSHKTTCETTTFPDHLFTVLRNNRWNRRAHCYQVFHHWYSPNIDLHCSAGRSDVLLEVTSRLVTSYSGVSFTTYLNFTPVKLQFQGVGYHLLSNPHCSSHAVWHPPLHDNKQQAGSHCHRGSRGRWAKWGPPHPDWLIDSSVNRHLDGAGDFCHRHTHSGTHSYLLRHGNDSSKASHRVSYLVYLDKELKLP